jgi:hypothetical protein
VPLGPLLGGQRGFEVGDLAAFRLARGGQLATKPIESGRLLRDHRLTVLDLPVDPLLHRLVLEDHLDDRVQGADVPPPEYSDRQCRNDRRRKGKLVADRHPHDSAEIHGGQALR